MFSSYKNAFKEIIETLEEFSAGNLERRPRIYSHDDIGKLAKALEFALDKLQQRIEILENKNNSSKAILNSMLEGVIVLDKETRIIHINPTIETIFSLTKEQAEGRFFLEVIPNNELADIAKEVFDNKASVSREISTHYPAESVFRVNASVFQDKDTVIGCLLVIHDITEIRLLEKMRRDFVANVSHELKTPLTSIKGFVETLLDGASENKKDAEEFLRIIQEHVDRLNNLINDLLDLSYLESKGAVLQKEKINLKNLSEKVITGFSSQIRKKEIKIVNEIPLGAFIMADKNKLEQVFTNLIDNGIKFNKKNGSLRFYAQENPAEINIFIEDDGMGIPPQDLPRIFERFYRVDKNRSRELGGTGLGLAIVKHIIELHAGRVSVESHEGFGAKFSFTLPK